MVDSPSSRDGDADKTFIDRWQRFAALAKKNLAPLLSRYTTHSVIVLLVVAALSLTGMDTSGSATFLHTPTPALRLGERDSEPVTARGGDRTDASTSSALLRAPVLRTTLVEPPTPVMSPTEAVPRTLSPGESLPTLRSSSPEVVREAAARREIITYTVRAGDTLSGIAASFGLQINTLIWSNPEVEAVPDLLRLGQELTILPVDGAYHSVVQGDTLDSIAAYYQVPVEAIVNSELNDIPPGAKLTIDLKLVVPGGEKPYIPRVVEHYTGPVPEDASRGTGVFGWPVTGRITCGFNCYPGHHAVDIGNAAGTPIYAADSGYVAKVGWSDVGYGKMILIDHGNGFQTLYAHLHVILVEQGASVAKGTLIGRMGATGNATGPHLHFEIRESGKQRNPLIYLPTE